MDQKLLSIYLNDHLAGATAGLELAKRSRRSNRSSDLGRHLDRLAREIEADRATLLAIMDRLEVGRDRVKVLAGWTGEKLGRLKLNGSLLSYSPLSRTLELEALALGVFSKRGLWATLRQVAQADPRLDGIDLDALAERADRQLSELEEWRLRAAGEALAQRSP